MPREQTPAFFQAQFCFTSGAADVHVFTKDKKKKKKGVSSTEEEAVQRSRFMQMMTGAISRYEAS